jgi:hypothetical protein
MERAWVLEGSVLSGLHALMWRAAWDGNGPGRELCIEDGVGTAGGSQSAHLCPQCIELCIKDGAQAKNPSTLAPQSVLVCLSRAFACVRACVCVCVVMRACVRACLRACVPACLRACVRACVLTYMCVRVPKTCTVYVCVSQASPAKAPSLPAEGGDVRVCVLALVRACACVRACVFTCVCT